MKDVFTPERVFDFNSSEIAMYNSKSDLDDSWRESMKEMDEVDALDNTGVWYVSTVMEKANPKNEVSSIMVKIGFR